MENYNGDCAYANGLPVSVEGLDVVMSRISDTKGTLSTQIGLHLRTIRLVWWAINALGGGGGAEKRGVLWQQYTPLLLNYITQLRSSSVYIRLIGWVRSKSR